VKSCRFIRDWEAAGAEWVLTAAALDVAAGGEGYIILCELCCR
jgi:hypothetical protein